MKSARFLGKRLLFVTAHPDDESFAVAGTIIKNRHSGGQSFLACATFGEKGKSHVAASLTSKQLSNIRKQELKKVSQLLRIEQTFTFGLPDKEVKKNQGKFAKKLSVIIKKIKPDYIISFGPDGLTGHTDHIAAGRVARLIAKKTSTPFIAFCAPPLFYKKIELAKSHRRFGSYSNKTFTPTPNVKIKVDSIIKLRAIKTHKSQYSGKGPLPDTPELLKKTLLNYEFFQI